ncbi:MAG: hypothetical protein E7549_01445 [Ruminococcaceae bacterium]|nr:hypothetical protein [Oscillospiraceae bacterium]
MKKKDKSFDLSFFFWCGQRDSLLTSATVHRTVAAKASPPTAVHPWSSFRVPFLAMGYKKDILAVFAYEIELLHK